MSQRFTLEWSFCTSESKRKENYSQVLAVSAFYVCELCRLNYVGELCESRKMKSRAELSAKPKHNIKVLVNQGATVPLRLRALTNKVTK